MLYIETDWDIPFYNMALEEYILTQLPEDEDCLFFYIHSPSVIVGRHQNTIEEINRDYVEANGIYVARRLSGGGAVYHDRGNLNYSVITTKQDDKPYDFARLSLPVLHAVRALGADARQSGRNDLTIDGRKFSGAAQLSAGNRLLHHGTLLFDSDLGNLQKALNVGPLKIESKGIKSVRSRVTNISGYLSEKIGIEDFRQIILSYLLNDQKCRQYRLSDDDRRNVEKRVREKFSTWAWNWGQSPRFDLQKTRKLSCGIVDLRLDIDGGMIRGLSIFGDFFALKDIRELSGKLVGTQYSKPALESAVERIGVHGYISGLTNRDFLSLLCD
jgi:lipoate-protein ligase A